MTIYIEDVIILNGLLIYCSIMLVLRLLNLKINYFSVFFCVAIGVVVSCVYPYIKANKWLYVIILLLPLFYSKYSSFYRLLSSFSAFFIVFTSYKTVIFVVEYLLNFYGKASNMLLNASLILLFYNIVVYINSKLARYKSTYINNKYISIFDKKLTAIVDTGNKIKYKGTGVVVLGNQFIDANLTKTDKYIDVKTINSTKKYKLYYIKQLIVGEGKNKKYYYNVPSIIENDSTRVILPADYR